MSSIKAFMSGNTDILCWAFLYKSNLKWVLIFLLISQVDTNIITGDIFFFKLFRVASSTVSYAKEMIDILVLNWLKESTCWHHMTEVILVKHMQITSLACWLITLRWLSIDDRRIKSKYLLLILPQPTFLASLLINTFASIWGIE